MSKVLALIGVSTYWGKRGLDGCLPEDMGLERDSTGVALLVLLVHATVGITLSIRMLRLQSRRERDRAVDRPAAMKGVRC